ncbi:hypothetical protein BWQ96_00668 [Gracilariopsis chorda]|uniref:Uncharacterized protein n=1 Tax=Gracilariopsis chorda TaxID=448386 RepID=A0A2V3J590_9FLOR|nr:hypothetical protein BWQ96_00668 [Gracilariopsis chorda]|eukprot:PXF49598.1 hypothetical protein BWQ96_00668 [Gracilariopsis chorda]
MAIWVEGGGKRANEKTSRTEALDHSNSGSLEIGKATIGRRLIAHEWRAKRKDTKVICRGKG